MIVLNNVGIYGINVINQCKNVESIRPLVYNMKFFCHQLCASQSAENNGNERWSNFLASVWNTKKKLIIFFFQMAINNPYYILWVLRHILWAFRKPLSFSIVSQFFSDVSVPGAARFSFYAHINLSSETTCTVHAHRTPTPTNNCKFKKVQYTRMKRWPCVFWVFSYVINIVCTPSMHRLYDS